MEGVAGVVGVDGAEGVEGVDGVGEAFARGLGGGEFLQHAGAVDPDGEDLGDLDRAGGDVQDEPDEGGRLAFFIRQFLRDGQVRRAH